MAVNNSVGMGKGALRRLLGGLLVALLAGCGGNDGGTASDTAATATVGSDGGSVSSASGVKVIVPAGAMSADTTIRIAKDSTGAPVLPQWARPVGDMLAITPHGGTFALPVTVRMPTPAVLLKDNERLYIAKAQPGGEWEVLSDTLTKDGMLEASVSAFSFFMPVVITYLPPAQPVAFFQPFDLNALTLECNGAPCANPELVRAMTLTVGVTTNGGQLPANCVNPQVVLRAGGSAVATVQRAIGDPIPAGSFTAIRREFAFPGLSQDIFYYKRLAVSASLRCTDPITNATSWAITRVITLELRVGFTNASTPYVVQFPTALTQAVGDTPTVRAVLIGGASYLYNSGQSRAVPTATDQAVVYLERLAVGDSAWRTLATSNQVDASPGAFAGSPAWLYWSFDYPLGAVSLSDHGASYRIRACYRAPTQTSTTCSIGPVARLSVVQSTQVPAFTQVPQSVLILPGQSASFSVVATCTPAPTLQWQTRPANSTGAWADGHGGGQGQRHAGAPAQKRPIVRKPPPPCWRRVQSIVGARRTKPSTCSRKKPRLA